jgi:hypothetical protein
MLTLLSEGAGTGRDTEAGALKEEVSPAAFFALTQK